MCTELPSDFHPGKGHGGTARDSGAPGSLIPKLSAKADCTVMLSKGQVSAGTKMEEPVLPLSVETFTSQTFCLKDHPDG